MLAHRVRRALKACKFSTSATPGDVVSPATRSMVAALSATLRKPSDMEDLVLTYGLPTSATVTPGGPSRPLIIVKVGGEVVMKDLPSLVSSLRFLRDFGLFPVVVHGGGPQLNDELAKAGVSPQYIGGHRVTDAPTMAVAKRVFEGANGQLAGALREAGLPVEQFLGGVFQAEVKNPELGLVGEITGVNAGAVNAAIAAGRIPVLTSLGLQASTTGGGGTLNINADVAARELAIALQPLRVVFISAGGGWKEGGVVIDELNMAEEYASMSARDYTGRQGTLLKLNEMKRITDALPRTSSVTQCSASALVAQLLPHKGPGTQIRKGTLVQAFDSPGATDAVRLTTLLEACGAGEVAGALRKAPSSSAAPAAAAAAATPQWKIFITEDYEGAAVVELPSGGDGGTSSSSPPPPRLRALVATPKAMGEGVEGALWKRLKAAFPGALTWVALPSTPPSQGLADIVSGKAPVGPALVFPPLSVARSGEWAQGSVSLGSGGKQGMWWGSELAGNGEGVGAVAKRFFAASEAGSSSTPPTLPPRPVAKGDSTTPSSKKSIRLGLLGARGFVGRELLTLLAGHSSIEVVCASSRALVGQPVAEALGVPAAGAACTPGLTFSDVGPAQLAVGAHPSVDAWILALPNGLCATHEAAIQAAAAAKGAPMPLLLDLSADQRFQAKGGPWVYGLPERHGAREALRTARKIANPGCYATGSQAALLPLLPGGVGVGSIQWDAAHRPHIFGVSGYSGAGTTPSEKNDPNRLRDNLLAYSLVNHIHEREIGYHCGLGAPLVSSSGGPAPGTGGVAFMPHVAPYFQGIHLTVSGVVGGTGTLTPKDFHAAFSQFYAGERLITVLPPGEMPDVARHGTLSQGVTVGGFTYDPLTRRLALVSCIDNLLKGAATQALQNINLALGLPEYEGIPLDVGKEDKGKGGK